MPVTDAQRVLPLKAAARIARQPVMADAACSSGKFDPDLWFSVSPLKREAAVHICNSVCPALEA
jgi:hypothetical protein